jgi:hypothetical protein
LRARENNIIPYTCHGNVCRLLSTKAIHIFVSFYFHSILHEYTKMSLIAAILSSTALGDDEIDVDTLRATTNGKISKLVIKMKETSTSLTMHVAWDTKALCLASPSVIELASRLYCA